MKKIAIFFICIILIIMWISYMYIDYNVNYNQAQRENKQYDTYLNQEIYASELTSIINKAVDNNEKNEVPKDKNGKYIANDTNSINIDVKMLDDEKTYYMEIFYNGGMMKFAEVYTGIKFKCTNVEYHAKTRKSKIYVV